MENSIHNLTVGMDVIYKGEQGLIISHKAGWFTVQLLGGVEKKARAKDIEPAEGGPRSMATQLQRYAPGYERVESYSGRKSLCTGDDLSYLLSGMSPEEVCRVAEKVLGLDEGELLAKYEGLNPGQKRMNAGNRIRSAIKRGDIEVDAVAGIATH